MAPATPPDSALPDQEALAAMAVAAQRARELAETDGQGERNPEIQAAYLAATRALARRRRERVFMVLSVVVAVLILVGATTLVTVEVARHVGSSTPPLASGSTSTPPRSTSSTSTSIPPIIPGGPPVVTSLQPASGTAGQVITVQGANFVSSDGRVSAQFGTELAHTNCPSATTCTVTVPPGPPGSGKVPVTITTASGTSNPVDFTYQ